MYGVNFDPYRNSKINTLVYGLGHLAKKGSVYALFEKGKGDFSARITEMNTEAYNFLRLKQAKVFFDKEDIITHAKLIVIDESIVIGSVNWGYKSIFKYNNTSIILKNNQIADAFVEYFNKIIETLESNSK